MLYNVVYILCFVTQEKRFIILPYLIKINGILLLIVRFVKSADLQIIRKNKPILMFLVNPSNFFTGVYLKPTQWPSTNVKKSSILGVVEVLDEPL